MAWRQSLQALRRYFTGQPDVLRSNSMLKLERGHVSLAVAMTEEGTLTATIGDPVDRIQLDVLPHRDGVVFGIRREQTPPDGKPEAKKVSYQVGKVGWEEKRPDLEETFPGVDFLLGLLRFLARSPLANTTLQERMKKPVDTEQMQQQILAPYLKDQLGFDLAALSGRPAASGGQ